MCFKNGKNEDKYKYVIFKDKIYWIILFLCFVYFCKLKVIVEFFFFKKNYWIIVKIIEYSVFLLINN